MTQRKETFLGSLRAPREFNPSVPLSVNTDWLVCKSLKHNACDLFQEQILFI